MRPKEVENFDSVSVAGIDYTVQQDGVAIRVLKGVVGYAAGTWNPRSGCVKWYGEHRALGSHVDWHVADAIDAMLRRKLKWKADARKVEDAREMLAVFDRSGSAGSVMFERAGRG